MKTLFLLYCTLDEYPRKFNQIIRRMAGVKLGFDVLNGKNNVKSKADFIEKRSKYKKKIRKSWISNVLKLLCQKGLVEKTPEGYRLIKPNVWSFMIGTGIINLDEVSKIEQLLKGSYHISWEDLAKIALLKYNPTIMFGRDKRKRLLEVINYKPESKHGKLSDNEVFKLPELRLSAKLKKRVATGYTPWWDAVWNEKKLRFYVKRLLNGEICITCLKHWNELWRIYKVKHKTKLGKGIQKKIACENPAHKGPICFIKTTLIKIGEKNLVRYELTMRSGTWSYQDYVPPGYVHPWR